MMSKKEHKEMLAEMKEDLVDMEFWHEIKEWLTERVEMGEILYYGRYDH